MIYETFTILIYLKRQYAQQIFVGLQDVFNVTIFGLPRRLEDVFQIRLEDVLEDKKLLC